MLDTYHDRIEDRIEALKRQRVEVDEGMDMCGIPGLPLISYGGYADQRSGPEPKRPKLTPSDKKGRPTTPIWKMYDITKWIDVKGTLKPPPVESRSNSKGKEKNGLTKQQIDFYRRYYESG